MLQIEHACCSRKLYNRQLAQAGANHMTLYCFKLPDIKFSSKRNDLYPISTTSQYHYTTVFMKFVISLYTSLCVYPIQSSTCRDELADLRVVGGLGSSSSRQGLGPHLYPCHDGHSQHLHPLLPIKVRRSLEPIHMKMLVIILCLCHSLS